jgi:hypothetical protein
LVTPVMLVATSPPRVARRAGERRRDAGGWRGTSGIRRDRLEVRGGHTAHRSKSRVARRDGERGSG